jgi:protein ImuB
MRRIMYLWLPRWPIDRLRPSQRKGSAASAEESPFATVADTAGRRLLAAVSAAATAAGLAPGMPLADALSFLPSLVTALAEPAEDAAALRRLAEWCSRYSPWTAPDGADGVRIEITGSAHLWGGEEALAADLMTRLERRGVASRIAIADTLGAAWATARFAEMSESAVILPAGKARAALAPLPVEALRLDPITAQGLRRVGLKRIGDLYAMPRDALARRFGGTVARLLDQALDHLPEPLSPLGEAPARRVRLSFAEPIADPADLILAMERLTADLVHRLAQEGTGARRLDLGFHRVDGRVERIRLGTARPSRDPRHLAALFKERLDTVDPGLGIEDMILAAFTVEPLPPEQIDFPGQNAGNEVNGIASLIDRLGNRLGPAALSRIEPRDSYIPECASVRVSPSPTQPCGLGPPSPALQERGLTRISPPLPPLAGGEGWGERLSDLSSGIGEVASDVASFGIEADEEFAGESDADDLFGLAGLGQPAMAVDEVGIISANQVGDDEQDRADAASAAAHRAFAVELAAVTGDRGEAGELGGGFVREGADFGQLGEEPGDGSIGHAFDGAEGGIELSPQRITVDQLRNLRCQAAELLADELQELIERATHLGVGHQTALVRLGGAQLGELARPGDQRGEPLLGVRGRGLRHDVFDVGKPGDDPGIDPIGLLQDAHGLGKAADRPRVDDCCRHTLGPQQAKGQFLVPARRLHRDKRDLVFSAEPGQRDNPGGIARKALDRPVAAEPGLKVGAGDIYSTNQLCHGNLPCPCDRQSSDCPVVRDTAAGGPKAHPRLWPEGARAPHAAHGFRWPPEPVQRRSHHNPAPNSRYKGG